MAAKDVAKMHVSLAPFEQEARDEQMPLPLTIFLALLLLALPLTNAGSAGVCKNLSADSLEVRLDAVPLDSRVNEFRAGRRTW